MNLLAVPSPSASPAEPNQEVDICWMKNESTCCVKSKRSPAESSDKVNVAQVNLWIFWLRQVQVPAPLNQALKWIVKLLLSTWINECVDCAEKQGQSISMDMSNCWLAKLECQSIKMKVKLLLCNCPDPMQAFVNRIWSYYCVNEIEGKPLIVCWPAPPSNLTNALMLSSNQEAKISLLWCLFPARCVPVQSLNSWYSLPTSSVPFK